MSRTNNGRSTTMKLKLLLCTALALCALAYAMPPSDRSFAGTYEPDTDVAVLVDSPSADSQVGPSSEAGPLCVDLDLALDEHAHESLQVLTCEAPAAAVQGTASACGCTDLAELHDRAKLPLGSAAEPVVSSSTVAGSPLTLWHTTRSDTTLGIPRCPRERVAMSEAPDGSLSRGSSGASVSLSIG
jgi:hypothetical protein